MSTSQERDKDKYRDKDKAKHPARPAAAVPSASGRVVLQKPVRFVTNNEEPQSKRRRISAACRTCQKRKIRCSGERPRCKTCLDGENECQGYAEQAIGGSKAPNVNKSRLGKLKSESSTEDLGSVTGSSQQTEREAKDDADVYGRTPLSTTAISEEQTPVHATLNDPKCVPYFRYFGPTAIVPGYKQMVVELNQEGANVTTSASMSEKALSPMGLSSEQANYTKTGNSPVIPSYKQTDEGPISPLIKDLCESFFKHLGCNYPFLTRKRFLRDLEERKVDPILVDAVCAIAARFSTNPALRNAGNSASKDRIADPTHKSKYGQVFARRAMTAMTDSFACPTIAAVQACLLLAYEQFGSDRDSGLWVYLGLSIRMAQDLGMHKLEGLRYEGHLGPTPKTAKNGAAGRLDEQRRADKYHALQARTYSDPEQEQEIRRIEKERINTFWAIFFLDRVVCSGTGRPVSLRDKDIEISFPRDGDDESETEWPDPFPALIRIVHLYGRVANLLNNIREVNQVTHDIMQQLVAAEDDLIGIYQRLSPNLHFSAANFQYYLKHSQATNFILLHFWFHTLIVLVHQPTLLDSFEGRIQQLFPNSIELSLSSAKTVADILSFAELLDSKSFIGNPFTSQPMYIAACAFLLESASHNSPGSQQMSSPYDQPSSPFTSTQISPPEAPTAHFSDDTSSLGHSQSDALQAPNERYLTKKSLLAAAASRNYQRCYKALKTLESYWAGTRYIVTVLDQKAKGSLDPILFTSADLEGGVGRSNPEAFFGASGWGDVSGLGHSESTSGSDKRPSASFSRLRSAMTPLGDGKSSKNDPSQAIGWSLTGSTNSPDTNLSFLYQTARDELPPRLSSYTSRLPQQQEAPTSSREDEDFHNSLISQSQASNAMLQTQGSSMSPGITAQISNDSTNYGSLQNVMPSMYAGAETHQSPISSTTSPHIGSLSTAFPARSHHISSPSLLANSGGHSVYDATLGVPTTSTSASAAPFSQLQSHSSDFYSPNVASGNAIPSSGIGPDRGGGGRVTNVPHLGRSDSNAHSGGRGSPYSDMIIESQDVDTSALGMDPLMWLDYMPPHFLGSMDPAASSDNGGASGRIMGSGHGMEDASRGPGHSS